MNFSIKYVVSGLFLVVFLQMSAQKATGAGDKEVILTVAQDGSGDYTTIQGAIDDCKSFPYERITIFIKKGVYKEKVKVHAWNPKLSLIGESREETIITYGDYFEAIALGRNGTFHTWTLLVEGNDFYGENLTIQNTAGEVGQAIALAVHADRALFYRCTLKGHQDTLYTSGEGARQYFKECYIEGTTDFIFGNATALFEGCTLHSKADSYITAASTPEDVRYGYVFTDCRLTADKGVSKVYLGRPWRVYAKTVFIGCEMGAHIVPEGWHHWDKPEAERYTFYAEYNSSGAGAHPGRRVAWSHLLKRRQAKKYTLRRILLRPAAANPGNWVERLQKR